jgi:hypothetical protein
MSLRSLILATRRRLASRSSRSACGAVPARPGLLPAHVLGYAPRSPLLGIGALVILALATAPLTLAGPLPAARPGRRGRPWGTSTRTGRIAPLLASASVKAAPPWSTSASSVGLLIIGQWPLAIVPSFQPGVPARPPWSPGADDVGPRHRLHRAEVGRDRVGVAVERLAARARSQG